MSSFFLFSVNETRMSNPEKLVRATLSCYFNGGNKMQSIVDSFLPFEV